MLTSIAAFKKEFGYEREATLKLLKALTDASLKQSIGNDHRTLGRIAWHLVTTYPEMTGQADLKFTGVTKEDPVPTRAADIVAAYQSVSDQLLQQVTTTWTDATLMSTKNFYGEEWPLGLSLTILIKHEAHHRGQMTVLMRQAGLTVPGVYGPAMEEWAGMGMAAPAV